MRLYVFAAILIFSGLSFAQSIEDELKLLGGEDFIIGTGKSEPANPTAENNPSVDTDTATTADSADTDTLQSGSQSEQVPQTAEKTSTPSGPGFNMPAGRGRPADRDTAPQVSVFDTAGVARERSIDFSRNLTEYRSPQKALFLSLLLPGAGQIYNKNYWRTGLYAAIEIGMIGGAVYHKKGARKIRKGAEDYADRYFSKTKLEAFYNKLEPMGNSIYADDESGIVSYLIYGEIYSDFASLSNALKDDWYSAKGIGDGRFAVQGWIDADPAGADAVARKLFTGDWATDSSTSITSGTFGSSKMQQHFINELNESQKRSNWSRACIVGIFANHVASAADAFISAILHNRRLLREESGEEITKAEEILSRISIESDMYFDDKNDLITKMGFVWRF